MVVVVLTAGCASPQVTQSQVTVTLVADGKSFQMQAPAGSTVQEALTRAGITLSSLDRVDPPVYTLLSEGAEVHVIRVIEEFEVEQVVIPFERQVIRNETLPEGETRLSQPGQNGLQEITYRRVFEDGSETARSIVRSIIVEEAIPEVVMVGSQTPFLSVSIPGRLAYLSAGNAWVMEGTTGNRSPVVTTGDLDGRIFRLSEDGRWLLYTRSDGSGEDSINSLWAARLDESASLLVDFKVVNVVHFAQFAPGSALAAYSTVEPRATAPGWQANNDLSLVPLSASGFLGSKNTALEINSGGVYGWWGTQFAFGPGADEIAYARPDSVGLVDLAENSLRLLMDVIPYQTGADWAWVPGMNWSPDGQFLFVVSHAAPEGDESPETSPQFDLVAVPIEAGAPIRLATQVGMFAYPVPSPFLDQEEGASGRKNYLVAYLQAISPLQSESSRYRLVVMDRDASNRKTLFPSEGEPGLNPQVVVWSPSSMSQDGGYMIAVLHQDNIWLVNTSDGQAQQITGDGLISRIDWR
jgi:resuscitation-promoting factor RpfB